MSGQIAVQPSVREGSDVMSLFLCFSAAAMVWAGLAFYSWRVSEAAVPQSEDFVQISTTTAA
ncbi:MAG: hypothetical protein QOD74_425 [Variibacter sp.]|nr:hypothetical protein [Variibacter sp.]